MALPAAVPDLRRPKNEVVFFMGAIGAAIVKLAEIIDQGFDVNTAGTWTGLAIMVLTLVGRMKAFGVETVEEIQRERDRALAASRES